jgi:tight adherence protein B
MLLPILTVAVFAVTMALMLSLLWFFVEAPLARRRIVTRLSALQQVADRGGEVPEVVRGELMSGVTALHRALSSIPFGGRVRLFLAQADVRIHDGTFLLLTAAVALVVSTGMLAAGVRLLTAVPAALGAGSIPFIVVGIKRRRRFDRFEEQFPEAMDLLGRAVRAGHAFTTGFELIGKELQQPVGEEFRIAFQQQNLGLPLREALENLAVRVPLPDVRIFVSALQIQRESGGNLAEVLDSMSHVIRERFKLRRQIRTCTAEGRLSSYMLTAIPFAALLALYFLKPGYLNPLLEDPRGQTALAAAAVLQVIGYAVIRRIVSIKV